MKKLSHFAHNTFSSEVDTIHNKMGKNEHANTEDNENILSVFSSYSRPFGKDNMRLLSPKEKAAAQMYILDNCDEVSPYIE